ncbi:hypothetical protein GD627_00795 [Arthrobacter yangruifuii]|uniref:Winged helix DNA-binding domain-containing protein n=1 Tax=Arthrobacter yangruifuii TaxID=2606616 RepID=A0A5N6MU95_9MICC|nr:hypothetical protein GD627_00795 [Arthrobacter yangruifuii]
MRSRTRRSGTRSSRRARRAAAVVLPDSTRSGYRRHHRAPRDWRRSLPQAAASARLGSVALELTDTQARRLRLRSHLLQGSDLAPADVVRRAVALQGQDLPAVLRAVAVRSRPGTTVQDVRDAFDSGELVRGWPMRGTLFATTPAHLAALLRFTAERPAPRRRGEGRNSAWMTLCCAAAERPCGRHWANGRCGGQRFWSCGPGRGLRRLTAAATTC